MICHLPGDHVRGFLEILPARVDNRHLLHLAPLNRIGLAKCGAVLQTVVGDVVHRLIWFQAQIHMCRRKIFNMEPDVSIQAILDELIVLVLVSTHVDGVGAASALEEEHHGQSQLLVLNSRAIIGHLTQNAVENAYNASLSRPPTRNASVAVAGDLQQPTTRPELCLGVGVGVGSLQVGVAGTRYVYALMKACVPRSYMYAVARV